MLIFFEKLIIVSKKIDYFLLLNLCVAHR